MPDLLVVQFPHPGPEHGQDRPGRKDWNLRGHRRKFMKSSGRWRTRVGPGAVEEQGDLAFWGEWEPPSRVTAELPGTARGAPSFLHEPLWAIAPDDLSAQNTDPYVFGDRFIYSNCKQNTRRGPLRTQRLANGSMILFGSFLAGRFVLDTVLVVAHSRPLDESTLIDVDPVFRVVTGDLLLPRDDMMTFRLYDGATPQNSVDGMFSFVPCLPFDPESPGFARPAIEIDRVINSRLKMGLKYTNMRSTEEVGSIWELVVEQVLEQGLALGVSMATPGFDSVSPR